jgi:hypothetical protein
VVRDGTLRFCSRRESDSTRVCVENVLMFTQQGANATHPNLQINVLVPMVIRVSSYL